MNSSVFWERQVLKSGAKGDDRKGNPQTSNGHGHQNCTAGENLTSRKLDKWNNNHEWVDVFPITNGEFPTIAMLVFRGDFEQQKLTNTNTSPSSLVWPWISGKDWHGLRVTLKVLFSIDSSRSSHTWVICILKKRSTFTSPKLHECPLKRAYFNRTSIFQPFIFRGHIIFPGSSLGVEFASKSPQNRFS